MTAILGRLLGPLDAGLSYLLADPVRLALWGVLAGVSSMLLYRRFSPQERIKELGRQAADARRALNQHDGAFADALPLMRESCRLSLLQLRTALLPSIVAGIPVLILLLGLETRFANLTVIPWGPAWIHSWLTAFFLACGIAALTTKTALRIK